MTNIGLLGDVHASYGFFAFALWKMHREGITKVVQVGDFGIGQTNYNSKFLKRASKLAEHYGIAVYVVPGNHEDWPYINQHFEAHGHDDWATLCPNILIAPRGLRWVWDDVSFVALGGAPSIDLTWRKAQQKGILDRKHHSWFPEEMITPEDVAKVAAGGYADVMIAHDAPKNVATIESRIRDNPHGFDSAGLLYAAAGRELMDQAFKAVSPKTFIHGHYHFPVNEMVPPPNNVGFSQIKNSGLQFTHILGLGSDGSYMQYSMGHYDTEKRVGHLWDVTQDQKKYTGEGNKFGI